MATMWVPASFHQDINKKRPEGQGKKNQQKIKAKTSAEAFAVLPSISANSRNQRTS